MCYYCITNITCKITKSIIFLMIFLCSLTATGRASSYDLRNDNLVSPIRDQGDYGTCWSFATLSSYESNWRMQRYKAGLSPDLTPDFSERYFAWLVYAPPTDLFDKSFINFSIKPISKEQSYSPEAIVFNQGGNAYESTAVMTRGIGAVLETTIPYSREKGTMQGIKQVLPSAGLLHDVYGLEAENPLLTVEKQKQRIKEHGAIYAMIWSGDKSIIDKEIYNPAMDKLKVDHSIALIGWDDEYIFKNFNDPSGQPLQGAWIVRNSWGTAAGDNGYYYISYQDHSLSNAASFIPEVDYARYTRFDHHAPLGLYDYYKMGSTGEPVHKVNFSSRYQAAAPQMLKAVGIYVNRDSTKYTIEVRAGALSPESGKVVYSQSGTFGQDGSAQWAGYRTVDLNQVVLIPQGNQYVVTVKLENEKESVKVPINYAEAGESNMPEAVLGNCFIQVDGIWRDAASLQPASSVAMVALSKDTILANGGDFTVAWLDDGGQGNSFLNLGNKDVLYGSDSLHPERKTLSNMTVDVTAGLTDSVYGGVIFGEGQVIKEGTGKLTLSNDNLYTGGTIINNGTFALARRLDGSGGSIQGDVTVNATNENHKIGRLQGNGTIYGKVINNGVVAPGNSIGTLTVGSFLQNEQGTLALEGGMNGGDKLRVAGEATINGTIHFIPQGYFANGEVKLRVNDFIEAGTLTLHPTQITGENGNSSTVSVEANQQNGMVTFHVSRADNAYSKTATTVDGQRFGVHLNQVAGAMTGDGQNLVGAIDFSKETVDRAGSALQPRPYDSLMYSAQHRSRKVADFITENMLAQEIVAEKDWNLFAQPLRITVNQSSGNTYDSFDGQSAGFIFGGKRQINDWKYNIYAGYLQDKTTVDSVAFLQGKSKGGFIGIQGVQAANFNNGFFTYGMAQLGFDNYDTTRYVKLGGYSRDNNSHWTGYNLLTEVGVGWKIPNEHVTWTPLIAMNYSTNHWPGFSETCSAGNASSLGRSSSNIQSLQSKVGIRAEFGNQKVNARRNLRYDLTALWNHEWQGSGTNYNWSQLGGQWQEKNPSSLGQDHLSVTAGINVVDDNRFSLRASLSKQFGSGFHGSTAGVECNWYF